MAHFLAVHLIRQHFFYVRGRCLGPELLIGSPAVFADGGGILRPQIVDVAWNVREAVLAWQSARRMKAWFYIFVLPSITE